MATLNPQRFELGRVLKRARQQAELKTVQVEQELGWYAGKVSRVETGSRVPVRAEVDRLADLYRLSDDERATLHLLADAARKREAPARVADFAQTYVTLERAAAEIRYYDAELIPGLLQTEDYARAVLAESRSEHVEERLADRVARQRILEGDSPVQLRVVLGEAAVCREVGGPDVLREQLEHLRTVGDLPNVRIRILPFASGAHRAMGVGFTHLRLDAPKITRVYIEGLTDATYIDDDRETAVYEADFERLWATAQDERESAIILHRRINQ